MAHKLLAVCLVALVLVGTCSGQTGKMEVQSFVNDISNKVKNVQQVSPLSMYTLLEQISLSINNMATAWWEIEWASQQSQWDNLVMLANSVVQQINQVLPSIPESSGQTWGSVYPRDDLASVAADICDQVSSLKGFAQERFGVLLSITSMTGCPETVVETAEPVPESASAPAPAVARRMLAA